MIWLTLLKDNWKMIVIALMMATIWALHLDVKLKEQHIEQMTAQISNQQSSITELNGQIKAVHDASAEQLKQAQQAETQRMAIVASIAAQVKNIANAPIPKDCPSAIEYGIQHKGDLLWPKP